MNTSVSGAWNDQGRVLAEWNEVREEIEAQEGR